MKKLCKTIQSVTKKGQNLIENEWYLGLKNNVKDSVTMENIQRLMLHYNYFEEAIFWLLGGSEGGNLISFGNDLEWPYLK